MLGELGKHKKVLLSGVIAIGVFAVVAFLWWQLPKWQIASVEKDIASTPAEKLPPSERLALEKDLLKTESDIRGTIAQTLGGIVLLIGIWFTWQNLQETRNKLEADKKALDANLQATRDKLEIDREGQITDRFTKAIAHLGSEPIAVRLGGIYALERIANESVRDYWPVMEVLTAYVRTKAPWPPADAKDSQISWQPPLVEDEELRPDVDIQAILQVIQRRRGIYKDYDTQGCIHEEEPLRLPRTNLRGALMRDTHLEHARFRDANLSRAHLERSYLLCARFGDASLRGADLADAHLEHAHLQRADLNEANLKGAHLEGTHLEGLIPDQIKVAKHWDLAYYSPEFLQKLGLPDDHNDQVQKTLSH